jgi:TonB family protein
MNRNDTLFFPLSVMMHGVFFLILAASQTVHFGTPKVTILTVETVAGLTPLGSGSGAPGQAHRITDQQANLHPSPMSGALKMKSSDLPEPAPVKKIKGKQAPKVSHAPSFAEVAKRELAGEPKIGQRVRSDREGELSEGGMGDSRKAGTATGDPNISGEIGGRGYHPVDWGFPRQLPEESLLVIDLVVGSNGLVKNAILKRASGHPEIDQLAISKARSMVFDPLPTGADQVDMQGELTFSFSFQPGKE